MTGLCGTKKLCDQTEHPVPLTGTELSCSCASPVSDISSRRGGAVQGVSAFTVVARETGKIADMLHSI